MRTDLRLPTEVEEVLGVYLDLVERRLPGVVDTVLLHGSICWDTEAGDREWYSGSSDVDFVTVLHDRPDTGTRTALADLHADVGELFPRPSLDGSYVTAYDLARPPGTCPDVPCILEGDWSDAGRLDVNPVTWHELAERGIVVRGEPPMVWTDRKVLHDFTRDNLESYWQARVLDPLRAAGLETAGAPDVVAWCVLGVSRLHHLLATDTLTPKTGAGLWALEAYGPRWRPLLSDALSWRIVRAVTAYDDDIDRRGADVVAFLEHAMAAARAIEPGSV